MSNNRPINVLEEFSQNTSAEQNPDVIKMAALPALAALSPHLRNQAIRLVRIGESGRGIRNMLISQGIPETVARDVGDALSRYRRQERRKYALSEILYGIGCVVVGSVLTGIAYSIALSTGQSIFMLVAGLVLLGLGWIAHGLFQFVRYLIAG
jgi:hypothetical protein